MTGPLNILITRPKELAGSLCAKLQALGHYPTCIPVIDLQPAPHYRLEQGLALFACVKKAIFISQAAVRFAAPLIHAHPQRWPHIQYAAIGPGTALALHAQGIPSVLMPETPPYETESLLRLPDFEKVQGQSIALIKGEGGREHLAQTLAARGALVKALVIYRRALPQLEARAILAHWAQHAPDLSVSTSASALEHLIKLFPAEALAHLRTRPLIVVGPRMRTLATALGFEKPLLATGADDSSIMKVLCGYEDLCG